jgi:cyclic beta-1,2-glucan synthetase
MYRAGVEGILGIRRQGDWLLVEPCIPAGWPGFEVTLKLGLATCRIEVLAARGTQLPHAVLDGSRRPATDSPVRVPLDGRNHELLLVV